MHRKANKGISSLLPKINIETPVKNININSIFQKLLSDFPAEKLHETIPHFHDSPQRFQHFLQAVEEDKYDRKKDCEEEIQFFLSHEKDLSYALEKKWGDMKAEVQKYLP